MIVFLKVEGYQVGDYVEVKVNQVISVILIGEMIVQQSLCEG